MLLIMAQITPLYSAADSPAPHTVKIKVQSYLKHTEFHTFLTKAHEFFKAYIPNSYVTRKHKRKHKQNTEMLVI